MSKLLSGLRTLFRRDPPDPRNITEISPDAAGREHDKLPCDVLVNDNFVTSSFPLASLPEDCLHVAFSHCSPRDLGRFACVSKAWKAAASVAWSRTAQPWLKPAASKFPALRIAESPSAAYSAVLKGALSEDGVWMLSADVSTGLLSLHLSAVDAFGITWLDKGRPTGYWEVREQVPGSSFSRCAYLNDVCWFNIEGDIDLPVAGVSQFEPGISHSGPQVSTFALPPGRYELLWKASKSRRFRWTDVPARASVDAQGIVLIHNSPVDFRTPGQPFNSRFPALAEAPESSSNPTNTGGEVGEGGRQRSRRENQYEEVRSAGWELYSVGEIVIEAGDRGPFHAKVSLRETEQGCDWKSKLYVDSLILSQLA